METPVFKSMKCIMDEFDKYKDQETGIAKDKQVDDFMKANFQGWMKNPSDVKPVEEMKAKVEALKSKGIDKKAYVELICLLLHAWSEDKIGVKGCEPSGSVPYHHYIITMNTPVLGNLGGLLDIFNGYAVDGIAKAEKVDQFMKDNFEKLIKHPTHPEVVKELVAKVDEVKVNGVDSLIYAGLVCNLLHAYSKDQVGVAENPETSS